MVLLSRNRFVKFCALFTLSIFTEKRLRCFKTQTQGNILFKLRIHHSALSDHAVHDALIDNPSAILGGILLGASHSSSKGLDRSQIYGLFSDGADIVVFASTYNHSRCAMYLDEQAFFKVCLCEQGKSDVDLRLCAVLQRECAVSASNSDRDTMWIMQAMTASPGSVWRF